MSALARFLIVSRKILPDYLDKVIYARNLLTNHEASTITEAVQKAGISRNTYYKYKRELKFQIETGIEGDNGNSMPENKKLYDG